MTTQSSHITYNLIFAILIFTIIAIAPAMAAMTVSGVKYMADVAPGKMVTHRITLSTEASDTTADYEITILGFGNGPNGNYLGIDPAQDTSPYSARPFITLDKTAVQIAPGGKEVITATIQVPASGNGGRYALINIRPKMEIASGGGTIFTTAMNVPVMITLKDTQVTETGTIESISVNNLMQEKSLGVTTVFTSTGNHHYYGAKNEIVVTDSAGKEITRTTTTPLATAIVPNGRVNFTQQITGSLSPGTYTVASSVFDSKEAMLDTKSTTFTLYEPGATAPTQTVSEAPTQALTEVPTQAVSAAPTAEITVATTGESPATPGAVATRAPLSVTTIVLALAAVSGIFVLRRKT